MRINIIIGAALLFAGVAAARADGSNPLDSKVVVDLGGFFLSTDINVRLDGEESNQVGDEIDFDDTFGVGDFERFRALRYRAAPAPSAPSARTGPTVLRSARGAAPRPAPDRPRLP
jgi:hypothetical protein